MLLQPQQIAKVPVTFPSDVDALYVEKIQLFNKSEFEFFGAPDSIITKTNPFLHISNFCSIPVHIDQERLLG